METDKVMAALDSILRRKMLRILAKDPMTVLDVLEELKKQKLEVKYRETVYRGLEKLFDAGLVDKSYVRNKGLCYRLRAFKLMIDLANDLVEKIQ